MQNVASLEEINGSCWDPHAARTHSSLKYRFRQTRVQGSLAGFVISRWSISMRLEHVGTRRGKPVGRALAQHLGDWGSESVSSQAVFTWKHGSQTEHAPLSWWQIILWEVKFAGGGTDHKHPMLVSLQLWVHHHIPTIAHGADIGFVSSSSPSFFVTIIIINIILTIIM